MRYEVIHFFIDLQDNNHTYNVGDTFPHMGMGVSEERIKELSGSHNKQGVPLIKKVEEEEVKSKSKKKTSTKKKRNKDAD